MFATRVLLRGSKESLGWYQHYLNKGPAGFKKTIPPTPFDWKLPSSVPRSKVYFDIAIANENVGRMVFELADDVVPKTVENFKKLATDSTFTGKGYKNTKFHVVQKGQFLMGGDVVNNDGSGSHSAYEAKYIKDENFIITHSERGVLRYLLPTYYLIRLSFC
jgi:hypothetical protein